MNVFQLVTVYIMACFSVKLVQLEKGELSLMDSNTGHCDVGKKQQNMITGTKNEIQITGNTS